MKTRLKISGVAAVMMAALSLTACSAPSSPEEVAEGMVDQVAAAIAKFDGAIIAKSYCEGVDTTVGYGALAPELAQQNGINLPVEVAVGTLLPADPAYYSSYIDKYDGDLFAAELNIPALASGSDSAATPDVLVVVSGGKACVATITS